MKMKAKYKKRWIRALRSDKYKQGKGKLKDGDKFCCLGVLCDLVKNEIGWEWTKTDRFKRKGIIGSACSLPETVIDLVGMDSVHGEFTSGNNKMTSLSDLNDQGLSFEKIADRIEKYL